MKSIQFNYFAEDDDLMKVANIILTWCPELTIFPPRGSGSPLQGALIADAALLVPKAPGEHHLLCSADAAPMVSTTVVDAHISCIDSRKNPVVEYSPSAPIDQETVKIGRFYANYQEADFLKGVRKLFRLLEKESLRLDDSGLWIFPSAASKARILRPWAGKDWTNPFFGRVPDNHMSSST